jgi:hypothetical protein
LIQEASVWLFLDLGFNFHLDFVNTNLEISMFKSVTNKSAFYGTADWQPIVINVKIHKKERKRLYSSNKENYLVETKLSNAAMLKTWQVDCLP